MPDFDPFAASFEEAQAQPDAYGIRGAVARWAGAQRLIGRRAAYEASPLEGIAVCVCHDLVAPHWLAIAFMRSYRRVLNCEVRTWDEAFGPALPKGKSLAAARRTRINRARVAVVFQDIMSSDPTRTVDAVVADVGKRVGEGKTRVENLYREAVAMGMAIPSETIKRLAGVTSPAKFRKPAGGPKRSR